MRLSSGRDAKYSSLSTWGERTTRPFEAHLAIERVPVQHGRERGLALVSPPFAAGVVREEHDVAGQLKSGGEHSTTSGEGLTVVRCRSHDHRIRIGLHPARRGPFL